MKKLLFAIAGAASFAALAADPSLGTGDISLVGFESYTVGDGVLGKGDDGNTGGGTFWSETSNQDASLVKAYAGGEVSAVTTTIPAPFTDAGDKYLALDTNGTELKRNIKSDGTSQTVSTDPLYIDTLVQFTPSESAPTGSDLTGAKLAIWLGVVNNVTNLYVQGATYSTAEIDTPTAVAYKITNVIPEAGTWYRLTVKAIPKVLSGAGMVSAFTVAIDGTDAVAEQCLLTDDAYDVADGGKDGSVCTADEFALIAGNKVFGTIGGTDLTETGLTSVGFKGTGALDDFVVTTNAPTYPTATIDFTLTWASGVTPVSYTIDGGTPVSLSGETSPFEVPGLAGGETVAFTFTNADGATKTMTATAADDGDIDSADATYVWADYLGAAVNGAYTIDDANDLDMLRKGVLANLATLGETFKQTANIDMSQAGPFAGIGTYAANASAGLPFQGTYDGQGFKISDIDFTQRNYGGVFNQVKGGAIKNLTVENITCSTYDSDVNTGEWGCAIVGNAGLGTTLQNLTAMGSFGTAAIPCRHNVAGIAIRLSGGASNVVDGVEVLETLVKDCTNNATLYGSYTKAAGITALTQDQNGVPNDYVLFDGCVNNANIAMVAGKGTEGRDGLSGIVGYVADGTKIKDCVNNGTLTSVLATAKIGGIVGWAQGRTLDDLGGNANPEAAKMIGDPSGSTITGFQYATVANNVATTVLPPLSAGDTYLLERNVAASETPVATLTAVGDTIAFDTALGYTFAGTVAGSGAAGYPTASTADGVITYTAGYFPRTATAGQDGSASNPFEIADEDDLLALQAAVDANVGRNLSYVQTADIALTAAWGGIGVKGGKDIVAEATYDNGAFTGVYDGGNYTISNFVMENGADYGALFNSIYQATVKNLKLSWGSSTFCANASSSGGDTGASFVGVAKESTLQNLTTVAGAVTTVSASKDMGGIVGYLMAGSTVDSCTNALNVASLKNTGRKCGGIAIITQGGTGTAVIRNCKNSGTVTAANKGGILGYVGVDTEIDGCENTAAVQLVHFQSGSVTASGVNKGNATVASNDKSGGVSGLYFATVSGDVATFVADNALALNGSYKVMSAGATATFAFAEAGTIAFDTALFTPTWAVTAGEGLTLTDATAGTVKTYTAASAAIPLEPGQASATTYGTAADATNAAETVTIAAPAAVATALGDDSAKIAAYLANFEAKVVDNGNGSFGVVVGLTEAAETALQAQADGDAAEVIDDLSESTVTLTTTPGFYYSFKYGTAIDSMTEGARTLATGDTLELTRPTTVGATAGFYKVLVNVAPAAQE